MTIPAKKIVTINPGVVSAGGSNFSLNGLFLTEALLMPTGQVLSFGSSTAVKSFFGPASAEYAASLIYFSGYANSTIKPSAMLFAAYNAAARSAFLQSGSLANMTLAQLQALSGTLILTVDGVLHTSSAIDLSGATSFTNAATLIAAGFSGGGSPTVTWNAVTSTFSVTSSTTGATSTITYATGTLSAGLLLTSSSALVLSQGAAADTPGTAMDNAVSHSQNWADMVTLFEPDLAHKELFAAWFTAQNNAYVWLGWDSDAQASVQNASEPFGVVAIAAKYNGVICIGGDPAAVPYGNTLAAMVMNVAIFLSGAIASVNFAQRNGRVTFAFLAQNGLLPTCANETTSDNLIANGYSFYGAYATRNNGFVFFNNGNMPGQFPWLDQFVNQVWLTDEFQVALMTLVTTAGSVPYDDPGYGLIRASLLDPISRGFNFGAIRAGISLSAEEISEVNLAAGLTVDGIISTQGWYLQILDPGAAARQARKTPVINFWYTDGGAVQQITMDSIDIL